MKVTYSPRAVAQIRQAFDYIAREDLVAADTFLARVEKMARLAARHRAPDGQAGCAIR
jgi:plasmid stabilization system protein ParE